MSGERTVAGAYLKIEAHEELCAERYKNIHGRLDLLFKVIGWGGAVAAGLAITIGGWGLNRLYEGQQQQNAVLQQLVAHR